MRFNEKLLYQAGLSKADIATLRALLANSIGIRVSTNQAGITAFAGGGQLNATLLTKEINEVSGVVATGDSVKLPSAVPGYRVVIINNGANALNVFPFENNSLGSGVNVAAPLAPGTKVTYDSFSATNWV